MTNLWILTEEKPKISTIKQILDLYCNEYSCNIEISRKGIMIRPLYTDKFLLSYIVEGVKIRDIEFIYINTVSGSSSFLDFLIYKQDNLPLGDNTDNLLLGIEETKTSDDESRNTGVYQRGTKFVYFDYFYPNVKRYMLYNDELGAREEKRPSDTSIFGTSILLTLGVEIIGKDIDKWFGIFKSLDDIICFKSGMRKPPKGNTPIDITKYDDHIEISGQLAKPPEKGNIGHDPNIGALSMISKCIRHFGYDKPIVITRHGVKQEYLDKCRNNKFLSVCKILNLELSGVNIPNVEVPNSYWHYETASEKIASIFLHVACEYHGIKEVYHNHAGCERGYFKTKDGQLLALPKKDSGGKDNLLIPDVVLYDENTDIIILVEGKRLETLQNGLKEIEDYDSIENEYIKKYYQSSKIERWVCIYGGNMKDVPHEKVILYLNDDGEVYINKKAPEFIHNVFKIWSKKTISLS